MCLLGVRITRVGTASGAAERGAALRRSRQRRLRARWEAFCNLTIQCPPAFCRAVVRKSALRGQLEARATGERERERDGSDRRGCWVWRAMSTTMEADREQMIEKVKKSPPPRWIELAEEEEDEEEATKAPPPRWIDLAEEENEKTLVRTPTVSGRRSTLSLKEHPKVVGFHASRFATEWGSRGLQDAIAADGKELQKFATVCRQSVAQLATDVHAHHALRAALKLLVDRRPLPCPFSEPLLEEVLSAVDVLAKQRYGCRVVIAAVAYDGGSPAATRLVDVLLQDTAALMFCRFGAHSLQAAVWHRGSGSRRGLEAVSLALQEALPECRQAWSLSCIEAGLEQRLPGLAMAVACSDFVVRGQGPRKAAKLGVLRWVMRDVDAREALLNRLDDHRADCAPWLVIGEMLGRAPVTYVDRACATKRCRTNQRRPEKSHGSKHDLAVLQHF